MMEWCFDLLEGLYDVCVGDRHCLSFQERNLYNTRLCKALKVLRLLVLWGKTVTKLAGNSAWEEAHVERTEASHSYQLWLASQREPYWLWIPKPRQAWRDYSLSRTFNSELIRFWDKNYAAMLHLNFCPTIHVISNNDWSYCGGNLLYSSRKGTHAILEMQSRVARFL